MAQPTVEKKFGDDPPIFTGNGEGFEDWYRVLKTFIIMNPTRFINDTQKITYTTTRMIGGWPGEVAASYFEEVMKKATDAGRADAPTAADYGTWADFTAHLEEVFAAPNKKAEARLKLDKLIQGSNSVPKFFQLFDQLARRAGITSPAQDDTLIDMLIKKLNRDIITRMFNTTTAPTTYAEYKAAALAADKLAKQLEHVLSLQRSSKSYHSEQSPSTSTTTEVRTGTGTTYLGAGQPMEIGRTKIDKEHAKKNGLCFKCGKPGHMSRQCPQSKKKPQQTPRKEDKRKYLRELYMDLDLEERSALIQDFHTI